MLEGEGDVSGRRGKNVSWAGPGTMAAAGEEHGVKNHSTQRLKVLVFVAPNP